MESVSIRPAFGPYALLSAVLITAGLAFFQDGLIQASIACWSLLAPVIVAGAFDKVVFDGRAITRRGPIASLLAQSARFRQRLSISDIETITTETTSVSFSGGDARLSYQTRITGAGVEFVIKSARSNYVPFIRKLFHAVGPDKLDPRSFELFEYFETGKALKNSPVLRNEIAGMPVPLVRRVANSLRLAGRLAQASSYFRIAYEREPRNPELLYEMSRFFHSSAQTEDTRLLQRSDACLRLASRLAEGHPHLLERIGESFFERLDYKRAGECFRRALELDPARFRANVGLAEIALRDGKLAHVAHFYNAASAVSDRALSRLAEREARYYERLLGDDGFLESELRRIRVSNQIRWARHVAALTFVVAWVVASVAGRFLTVVEDFGWALMATSGLVWCAASFGLHHFKREVTSDE